MSDRGGTPARPYGRHPNPTPWESLGLDVGAIDEDSRRAPEAALLSLARGLDDYGLEPCAALTLALPASSAVTQRRSNGRSQPR